MGKEKESLSEEVRKKDAAFDKEMAERDKNIKEWKKKILDDEE
ncbi:hypothetical protein ABEW00_05885 [Rossellomorea vietnamensis]